MRPGKAPASPSSKPVIVGHKPQVKDTSVTVNGVGERPPMAAHKKIEVTTGMHMPPIEVPNEPDPAPVITHDNLPEKEVEALATVALDNITDKDLAEAEPPKVEPGAAHKPIPPLPADALLETTAAPEVDTEGIVVSNHAAKSGSAVRTIMLVLIVLVLAAVILDILLDAGFIKSDALPQTDLF